MQLNSYYSRFIELSNPVNIRVSVEDPSSVDGYALVPIAFEVASIYEVDRSSVGGPTLSLVQRSPDQSYTKDYDAVWGDSPLEWAHRFDLTDWNFFAARVDGRRAGGAVLVMDAPDVDMLEGRGDLALVWDLRVAPEFRSRGIGSMLLDAIEAFAKERGARELKVETQNINVAACRFYKSRGFSLRCANAGVYEGLPEEIQLLWYKSLEATA